MHEELRDSAGNGSADSGIDVVLVTGLSGAGRGTAAKVLEALGVAPDSEAPAPVIGNDQTRASG